MQIPANSNGNQRIILLHYLSITLKMRFVSKTASIQPTNNTPGINTTHEITIIATPRSTFNVGFVYKSAPRIINEVDAMQIKKVIAAAKMKFLK
jgi:hypothetical protein